MPPPPYAHCCHKSSCEIWLLLCGSLPVRCSGDGANHGGGQARRIVPERLLASSSASWSSGESGGARVPLSRDVSQTLFSSGGRLESGGGDDDDDHDGLGLADLAADAAAVPVGTLRLRQLQATQYGDGSQPTVRFAARALA